MVTSTVYSYCVDALSFAACSANEVELSYGQATSIPLACIAIEDNCPYELSYEGLALSPNDGARPLVELVQPIFSLLSSSGHPQVHSRYTVSEPGNLAVTVLEHASFSHQIKLAARVPINSEEFQLYEKIFTVKLNCPPLVFNETPGDLAFSYVVASAELLKTYSLATQEPCQLGTTSFSVEGLITPIFSETDASTGKLTLSVFSEDYGNFADTIHTLVLIEKDSANALNRLESQITIRFDDPCISDQLTPPEDPPQYEQIENLVKIRWQASKPALLPQFCQSVTTSITVDETELMLDSQDLSYDAENRELLLTLDKSQGNKTLSVAITEQILLKNGQKSPATNSQVFEVLVFFPKPEPVFEKELHD